MSWDLFVQDWGDFNSLDEIPDNFEPRVIGKRTKIIEKIKELEPSTDFSDPSWGTLDNDNFSVEFNMGDDEDLQSFAMHVRGNELAVPVIGRILSKLKLRAADTRTSKFFNVEKE